MNIDNYQEWNAGEVFFSALTIIKIVLYFWYKKNMNSARIVSVQVAIKTI